MTWGSRIIHPYSPVQLSPCHMSFRMDTSSIIATAYLPELPGALSYSSSKQMPDSLESYADDGSARFNSNDDFAQSPVFAATITQVTMRVKSSSLDVTRILKIIPTDPKGATKHAATPTERDHLADETFSWSPSEGVRAFKLQNEGDGRAAGWGVAALTVYLDRIAAPTELRDDPLYRDAFFASWQPDERSVSFEVNVGRVVTTETPDERERIWDFSSLTNTGGNTITFTPPLPGSLAGVTGENLCLSGKAGGHIQVGKSGTVGRLVLPLGKKEGGVSCSFTAWHHASDGDGDIPVSYVTSSGETRGMDAVRVTGEPSLFQVALPEDAASLVLSSYTTRRLCVSEVKAEADFIRVDVTTNHFATVRTRQTETLIKDLAPGDWAWSVRAFDAKGIDSPWSPFRAVTLDPSRPPRQPPGFGIFVR